MKFLLSVLLSAVLVVQKKIVNGATVVVTKNEAATAGSLSSPAVESERSGKVSYILIDFD